MKEKIKPEADYLFEVSWEVCNKIGGIWTVLKSKAAKVVEYYGSRYFLVGPYFPDKHKGEFKRGKTPREFAEVFSQLEKEGIRCHFGEWLVEGEPKVILIDFNGIWPKANDIKKELWEGFKIDSLNSPHDFTEPMVWAYSTGKLLEKIAGALQNKKIVAQFHEWLSGAGLLYLKKKDAKIATIFATHGTVLGRTLANNSVPLYSFIKEIDPFKEAYKYNVQAKYLLERRTAETCDVFGTVSAITAMEGEWFLNRKADVLFPNGLDIAKFPTFEEIVIKHRVQRRRLREFLFWYFFPYYSFDVENTLFFFTIGRYEFNNKGIGVFIKALGRLNEILRKEKSKKTVIAFFWIPAEVKGIRREVTEAKEFYFDIKDYLEEIGGEVEENILQTLLSEKELKEASLFADEETALKEIKKKVMKFRRQDLPPLSTHNLADENDIILKSFRDAGLLNKKEDKVKVIFYPIYLTGTDGLLNLNSYEAIQGSHVGVFPSFYEPWGYTTLETAALGVASITTDLSGFGRFCAEIPREKKQPGVFMLERADKTEEEVIKGLSEILHHFFDLSRAKRIANKIQARKIAEMADWGNLIKNYLEAHNQAIRKLKRS